MTEKTQNVIEKIKAYSFPALIAVVGYFLIQTLNRQSTISDKLDTVNENVIRISGAMNTHDYRLNTMQNTIDYNSRRIDNLINEKTNKSNK